MADLNKLKNVVNAIVSEDTDTATENLNSFIAEMTKEILGEVKKAPCKKCGKTPCECTDCDCGKDPCDCGDKKCEKCGKSPCECEDKTPTEECEM
ncbi:MAG: hypothetical protein KUG49_00775 [Dokdonia sp.]|nr:hypothetical protein [Dokdonia sp.]